MHSLKYIEIRNFKLCRKVSLSLGDFTPLVGQNNVGKSTILQAINWVLKPTSLSNNDFFDPNEPVEVYACIDGIDGNLLNNLKETRHKSAIEPYCNKGYLWIRVTANQSGAKSLKQEVYNFETYSGEGIPNEWRDYPTGLPQAITAILPEPIQIEAMEDIGEDLGKVKAGTTIKGLLDEVMEPILKAHSDLNNALQTVKNILNVEGKNRSSHLNKFDEEATEALKNFFPGLRLELDLQTLEIKEFFKAGDLHVTDECTGDRRRFDQIGTGAQRAIQMSLIKYLAKIRSSALDTAHRRLLLIDEPELYLHPQAIKHLRESLKILSQNGFQIIFSTHSPSMLSEDNASDTIVITKNSSLGSIAKAPLKNVISKCIEDAQSQARVLFQLGNLAEIYFSEIIILCEGKTDLRILPRVYETLFLHKPEIDKIAFLSLGSCSDIPKALKVLSAMQIQAIAIADLDFAFTVARKEKYDLLDPNGKDFHQTKEILEELSKTEGFTLSQNKLPTNDGIAKATDAWRIFAQHKQGKDICATAHEILKQKGIWIWPTGSIEDITQYYEKGEDAIICQEEIIRDMTKTELCEKMPGFIGCFEWIEKVSQSTSH